MGLYDYHARFYDGALGRFLSADVIVPNPLNPQAFNRYSYTLNNPIRYNDPSGYCIDPGDAPPGSIANRNICHSRSKPVSDLSNRHPSNGGLGSPRIQCMTINGKISCFDPNNWSVGQTTQSNNPYLLSEFAQITGITPWSVCAAFFGSVSDPVCNPENWASANKELPSIITSQGAPYLPDVVGVGFGGSIDFMPGKYSVGVEGLYISGEKRVAGYNYGGPSASIGEGGYGSVYAIFGFNVHTVMDYAGPFNIISATASYGAYGGTASYFWAGENPFASGVPKGFTIGWAPGADLSVSYSQLEYNPFGVINVP